MKKVMILITIFTLLMMVPAITMAQYKQENNITNTESSDCNCLGAHRSWIAAKTRNI